MVDEIPVVGGSLLHIGIKRRSGRYPWGSGKDPYQRSVGFQTYRDNLRSTINPETGKHFTDAEIAKSIQDYANKAHGPDQKSYEPGDKGYIKFNTSDLRAATSISTDVIRAENVKRAQYLRDKRQMSNGAIAELMLGDRSKESTVRGWLAPSRALKADSVKAVADMLKEEVAKKEFLDVGRGEHLWMGITNTKLLHAVATLKDEGYQVHNILTPQLGMKDKMTELKVLVKEGVTWDEARQAVLRGDLRVVAAQSDDGGLTFKKPKEMPVSVNSKRIDVRFAEDGGSKMDGVIELRRGVPDLDLGENRYAQVRIAVDGTHYMKGMAMYADDLPAGVDMRFNSNKSKTDPKVVAQGKLGAMKPMETDSDGNIRVDNPFGSTTTPRMMVDKNGKEFQSPLNLVGSRGRENVEGRWDQWSKNLSSQMLSKQSITLAKEQLGIARKEQEKELNKILNLTNPVLRKALLDEFADGADAAAVHLKAAQMPRQSTHVLLPMNSMRPNEIYAPSFNHGEKVVLVRHPHAGPFEIPELTVNNNNRTAKRILGNAIDAVGIHHSVAEQLSGADFDGDAVLVIPNNSRKVKTQKAIPELATFDPKVEYKITDDDTTTKRMTKHGTQSEMGRISNLITDMQVKGASPEDVVLAVRHSMVVIDAEKHGLDYKRSEQDHQIARLKETYQGKKNAGASTLISRSSAEARVPQRKYYSGKALIDPVTGDLRYEETGKVRTVTDKQGRTKEIPKQTVGTRMGFAKDARELLSGDPNAPLDSRGYPMERVYADYANSMKNMARTARLESLNTKMPRVSPASKELYKKEVADLTAKLQLAQRNAPLERRAQVLARAMSKDYIDSNPQLDKDDIKKVQYQALAEAREITGSGKQKIYITDNEWTAIQAGAVPHSNLSEIFRNSDMDRVRELATPRSTSSLTPGQLARARQMQNSNRPISEIAAELGIPRSTLIDNLSR